MVVVWTWMNAGEAEADIILCPDNLSVVPTHQQQTAHPSLPTATIIKLDRKDYHRILECQQWEEEYGQAQQQYFYAFF